MAHERLVDVAWQLYDAPPAEFTAARNARAAELRSEDAELAGRVAKLRRASIPAWVVGQLVRHRGEQITHLLQLAERLRAAQENQDGSALGQLARDRRRLTAALARDGAELADERGIRLSPTGRDEVAQTLQAAMADAAAAAAVASGRLVRTLQAVGFEVDLDGAMGGPPPAEPTIPEPMDDLAERRARRAARAIRDAERAAAEAGQRARRAASALRDTVDRRDEQQRRRDRASKELDAASVALARLDDELDECRREATETEALRDAAQAALDRARDRDGS